MKISRTELLTALDAVMPGIGTNDNIIQSSSFVFTKGRVFTFNDEIAVSHPVKLDIEGAVPAKAFRALINKVKTETVDLVIKKGELFLTSSKAQAGLRLEAEIKLPLEELGMPTDWIELPEKFSEALKFCLFSASKDQNKGALTCLHVFDKYVESCDNYRITRYDMGKGANKAFPDELLIPAFAAKDVYASDPVEYAVTDGWLHFRNEKDVTYSCRYMEVDYPDFTPFLECEGESVVFPDTLPVILDRADVLGDGERVSLVLESGELVVCTENESGWFEESVDIKYDGEPAEFGIQPEFLKAIMKFKGEASISDKMLRFDSGNFVHVCQILAPKAKK